MTLFFPIADGDHLRMEDTNHLMLQKITSSDYYNTFFCHGLHDSIRVYRYLGTLE